MISVGFSPSLFGPTDLLEHRVPFQNPGFSGARAWAGGIRRGENCPPRSDVGVTNQLSSSIPCWAYWAQSPSSAACQAARSTAPDGDAAVALDLGFSTKANKMLLGDVHQPARAARRSPLPPPRASSHPCLPEHAQ